MADEPNYKRRTTGLLLVSLLALTATGVIVGKEAGKFIRDYRPTKSVTPWMTSEGIIMSESQKETRKTPLSELYNQAVAISSGEDRYWSMEEKAKFFTDVDIRDEIGNVAVLQDGDVLYGRKAVTKLKEDSIEMYSSTRDYKFLGYASREKLESFIKSHSPAKSPLLEK